MKRRAAVAAVALLGAAAPAAAAAPHAVFGLRAGGNPKLGYFVYPLRPGAAVSGSVIVSNAGTATGTVRLYAVDATTGATSGTVYRTSRRPGAAGSWIALASSRLTLAPGAYAAVPFTVRAPAGARPGQWVGGIAAESPEGTSSRATGAKGSLRIRVRNLSIIGVEVDVPGPGALAFRIGAVRAGGADGYQQLLLHVADTGALLSRPAGTVTVARAGGKAVQTLRYSMDTFLPQTAIDYPLHLRTALGPGRYTAAVELHARPLHGAGGAVVVRATRTFVITSKQVRKVFSSAPPTVRPAAGGGSPWTPAAAAAGGAGGALALAGAGLLLLRRRRPATP